MGSTNRLADRTAIAEIQRVAHHQSFDELPNLKAIPEDIDFSLAKDLFSQVGKKFDKNVAKSLHLLVSHQSNDYPSNGGLLLFGKKHTIFFPDATIRCGCFAGSTKSQIIDQQDIELALPVAIDRILAFIERNTSQRSYIEKLRRVDIPQYPPTVVREAILNALVHADYSVKGASIQVAIFVDRLEITNPGALPFGLSLEKALSGISQLRNRVLGHFFKELGFIERWGSGLGRMIEICHEQGITEPKFEEMDHHFRVTLYYQNKQPTVKESWQKELLEYINTHQSITTKEASKFWKVTERTASTRLKKMCDNGTIVEISTGPYDPKKKFTLVK